MASMNSVIAYVDSVKPNAYSDEVKYGWLNTLEGMLSAEVFQDKEPLCYELPADADRELRAGHPYEKLYALYIEAMIDFHNREYNNYNAVMVMFNSEFDEYKKAYIRENMPKSAGTYKNVM